MSVTPDHFQGLNEYFSGFASIGHNSLYNLIVIWIIPNGAWMVVPSFMICVLGKEILESMGRVSQRKED